MLMSKTFLIHKYCKYDDVRIFISPLLSEEFVQVSWDDIKGMDVDSEFEVTEKKSGHGDVLWIHHTNPTEREIEGLVFKDRSKK